ncbi:hypothetical protein ACPB9E_26875 [Streptomyces exfoliatus]|uniref:hypothetical protein n=1 Tax=Streptomyces exfoliatus TaxID=1905 RepID=UPI003C2E4FA7
MVWTPEHTGLFLDHAADDRLYALFHLVAFRGEACGQKWTDTHLDADRERWHTAWTSATERRPSPPAAGAGPKAVQEMRGHSSIAVTADTYTSLLSEADLATAEATARLVPRARMPPCRIVPVPRRRYRNLPRRPRTQTAPDEESEAV